MTGAIPDGLSHTGARTFGAEAIRRSLISRLFFLSNVRRRTVP